MINHIETIIQPYRKHQQPSSEAMQKARKFLEACVDNQLDFPTVFVNHLNHYEFVSQPLGARWTLEIDSQGKMTVFINGWTKDQINTSISTVEAAISSLQSFLTTQKFSPLNNA